ncbi:MAG TPA: trigger factor [Candidatus Limnocylindria bacterium]|nr:trigger factor [Candidatus Limnocylindria bacterium]
MVNVSTRPEPGSKMVLEIEVPPAEVDKHFATAYRHVAERTRVPGFRPGKAPRAVIDRFVGRGSVLAEVIDHLVSDSYEAALNQTDVIPIDQPDVDIDPANLTEGQAITFTATVPVRPDVQLGAYTDYPFTLEVPEVTDEQVEQVIAELREQQATLRPVDGRAAREGDIASVKFVGTVGGEPFEGGSADQLPVVIGENRMIPGWEEHLVGMEIGATKGFDITFPDDYRVEDLRGKEAHFEVELLDLREKLLPEVTDDFARSVGDVQTVDELRAEIRDAMTKRADAESRHQFGDRIIDFAVSNATVELPEVMVANEIEIMRDELRTRLAQQRIGMEQYLALAKQTPEELATELREPASRRVKTLLVLSAIAEKEGVDATDTEVDAEIAQQLAMYDNDPKLTEYLTSRRGRSYLRMTLRNRKLVDTLMDRALGTDASASEASPEGAAAEAEPTETENTENTETTEGTDTEPAATAEEQD